MDTRGRLRTLKNTESVPLPEDLDIIGEFLPDTPLPSDNDSIIDLTPIPLNPITDEQSEFTLNDVVLSDSKPGKRVGNPTAIPAYRKDAQHFTPEDEQRFARMAHNWRQGTHTQGRGTAQRQYRRRVNYPKARRTYYTRRRYKPRFARSSYRVRVRRYQYPRKFTRRYRRRY